MLRSTIMWKIFTSKDISINNNTKLPICFVSETLKNQVSYLRNAGTVAVNKKPQNKLLLLKNPKMKPQAENNIQKI